RHTSQNKMAKSVKRIALSEDKIHQLIESYRENECLWQVKSPHYKNYIKKKAAIADIAEKMGITKEITKKKIASLRSTYLLEKKKIADSKSTGSGTDTVCISTIPWFNQMEFLDDVIIARRTISNLDTSITQDEKKEQWQEDTRHSIEIQQNTEIADPSPSPDIMPYFLTPQKSSNVKKRKNDNKSSDQVVDMALKKLCKMTDPDICDNFGSLLASQSKAMPPEDSLELQAEISALVHKRLLIRCKRKSAPPSAGNNRPSTSSSYYSSEDTRLSYEDSRISYEPNTPVYQDLDSVQNELISKDVNDYETDDNIITRAFRGLL
ncbi:hypothetical protein PV326_010235, partial [Microctonus aethiopoides]